MEDKRMRSFKAAVYMAFQQIIDDRISGARSALADLRESAANETKSTAGDKHETALAMLQIEQANTARQLDELLLQKKALDSVRLTMTTAVIVPGTVVLTNNGYLFLSAALGKVEVQGKKVVSLSPQSPLGRKLAGMKVNDVAEVHGKSYEILELF